MRRSRPRGAARLGLLPSLRPARPDHCDQGGTAIRALAILALTLLLVAWAPLVDQLPAAEIPCNPDIRQVASELGMTPTCYLVDQSVLAIVFALEPTVHTLGGEWQDGWWPSSPYSLDRPVVVAGHQLGLSLYRLSDSLTGLVILEVPP